MWPEGNASDLQTVMALQNIKKADQLAVLEQYGLLHPNSGKEENRIVHICLSHFLQKYAEV